MKISLPWLKELVDFNLTPQELADQLSLRSIGVKTVTEDYIELDLTYNRGDLLSLRGVAREVAAIIATPIKFKPQTEYIWEGKNLPKVKVEVQDNKLCPLYCVAKIENLTVEQSDKTYVKKLSDSGIRSINNVADVTNLVMIEYGQPMHAFDASKVKDETILVRTANTEENLTTLDEKNRKLDSTDLLITDPEKTLGIAGVMGGKDSEVSTSTTAILLEAAIFDPVSIRKTSKRHGLYSEASKRFQHGLTKTNLLQALSAAIKMYEKLGGKLTAISLIGDLKDKPKVITLSEEKLNSLVGVEISSEIVESLLQKLGFRIYARSIPKGYTLQTWKVEIPFWRLDINIEEDLIEEVARMYGYEKIGGIKLADEETSKLDEDLPKFIYSLKLKLKNIGLTEVQTYSFYSSAVLEALEFTEEGKKNLIKVANPISSETEYLRLDLWPNLLEVVGKNIKQGFKDIAIFEVGNNYFKNEEKPEEKYRLSVALMNNTDNPLEELASLIQNLSLILGGGQLNPASPPPAGSNLFHPKRFINIEKEGKMIAGIAEVHLRLLNKLGIEKRVAVMEINLKDLID